MLHVQPNRILRAPMSAAMVRAIQGGFKDTTRRLATSPLARAERGDLIWVQEAIEIDQRATAPGMLRIRYAADGPFDWREVPWPRRLARPSGGTRIPRFMPRELSRITLMVRRVEFQRLQDMSEGSARAEGVTQETERSQGRFWWVPGNTDLHETALGAFAELWDTLHADEGTRWAENPEVVAITFDRLGPIDKLIPGLGSGGVR